MARRAGHEPYYDDEAEPSGPQPADWALLFLRSALRRKLLFVCVFVSVAGAAYMYFRTRTPIYRIEAKIFVQRQQIVPSTVRPAQDESPTRTAWELVHRRENLIALARAAKLVGPGVEPPGAAPDGVVQDDPLERVVRILDRRLVVAADEGTIGITLDWPDPQQGYRLVDGALTNFIEARHVQEVTAIDEVISVLRARAAKAKEELELVTDQVRREGQGGPREAVVHASSGGTRQASEELTRLRSLLESKTRAIADVEEFRRRRLAEMQAQLVEKRNMYSDAHPSVIQLKQDIEALSKESDQVSQLRQEEAALQKQVDAQAAREGVTDASGGAGAVTLSTPSVPRQRAPTTPVEEDERVRGARAQYQQIVERVTDAQLELDAVRAAFKYRYNVIWPPQVPVDPVSPNPVKILGAGILLALLLATFVAAVPDLRTGRIVERWQIERSLDLPILGELSRK